jgi:hypothetical protein
MYYFLTRKIVESSQQPAASSQQPEASRQQAIDSSLNPAGGPIVIFFVLGILQCGVIEYRIVGVAKLLS